MSEAGWLGLATLLVNAVGAGFLVWMKFKMATIASGVDDGNKANAKIIDETKKQTEQLATNHAKLETVHGDLNGGLAKIIAAQVELEVAKRMADKK